MIRHSIYMQLVSMLIGIVIISNLAVMAVFILTTERSMVVEMRQAMTESIAQIRELHSSGAISAERIPGMLQSGYFRASYFTTLDELRSARLVHKFFSEEDLLRLQESGEAHSSTAQRMHFRLPASIIRLQNQVGTGYLLVSPNLGKITANFRYIIVRMNIVSLIVGSIMVLIAGKYIVRPIKILSAATEQISRGDFDVTIADTRRDELGQLIRGFNLMAKELRGIEMMRKDFVTAISHEFRTPLTSIKGYAKLLGETEQVALRREYAAIVAEETDRLAAMSSNILLMSQLESGLIDVPRAKFRLDEQLRRVVLLLERQWSAKGLDLALELNAVEYEGNADLLFQVWLNLLDNAIKYSPLGARIQISLDAKDGEVSVVVRDYGPGISPEDQTRVFEKFYKGDKARGTPGSGLGLSIAKRIVELHEGSVTLHSAEQQGTEVTVVLTA